MGVGFCRSFLSVFGKLETEGLSYQSNGKHIVMCFSILHFYIRYSEF